LFIVMLLGGLWHGAAWNFVIWGGLHGGLLAIERMRGKSALYGRLPGPARVAATFAIVLVTWVFFRSPGVPEALRYLGDMAGLGVPEAAAALLGGIVYQPYYLMTFVAAAGIVWIAPQTWEWAESMNLRKGLAATALMLLAIAALTTQAYNPFIYFIF
jgi:alginate O-acetyltransferase complex protein AlgI